MTNSPDPTSEDMIKVMLALKSVEPKTPEGEFVYTCNLLAFYCVGYAKEIMNGIMESDPIAKIPGTPSQVAMMQTLSDMVRDVVSQQSIMLSADKKVIEGAQAFWKMVSPRSRQTVKNVDVMMADISLLRLAEITARGSEKDIMEAVGVYNLLAKPCHGSA